MHSVQKLHNWIVVLPTKQSWCSKIEVLFWRKKWYINWNYLVHKIIKKERKQNPQNTGDTINQVSSQNTEFKNTADGEISTSKTNVTSFNVNILLHWYLHIDCAIFGNYNVHMYMKHILLSCFSFQ